MYKLINLTWVINGLNNQTQTWVNTITLNLNPLNSCCFRIVSKLAPLDIYKATKGKETKKKTSFPYVEPS